MVLARSSHTTRGGIARPCFSFVVALHFTTMISIVAGLRQLRKTLQAISMKASSHFLSPAETSSFPFFRLYPLQCYLARA